MNDRELGDGVGLSPRYKAWKTTASMAAEVITSKFASRVENFGPLMVST